MASDLKMVNEIANSVNKSISKGINELLNRNSLREYVWSLSCCIYKALTTPDIEIKFSSLSTHVSVFMFNTACEYLKRCQKDMVNKDQSKFPVVELVNGSGIRFLTDKTKKAPQ